MKRIVLTVLASLVGGVSYGQDSSRNCTDATAPTAAAQATNNPCPQQAAATSVTQSAPNSFFSSTVTSSSWIPLDVAQAMLSGSSGSSLGVAAAANAVPQGAFSASPNLTINNFPIAPSRGFVGPFRSLGVGPRGGFSTYSAPAASTATPLGYMTYAPTTVNSFGAAPASNTPYYTVYYRGSGSIVLNSARLFPVDDGRTMVPVYVPTPIATPANLGR